MNLKNKLIYRIRMLHQLQAMIRTERKTFLTNWLADTVEFFYKYSKMFTLKIKIIILLTSSFYFSFHFFHFLFIHSKFYKNLKIYTFIQSNYKIPEISICKFYIWILYFNLTEENINLKKIYWKILMMSLIDFNFLLKSSDLK